MKGRLELSPRLRILAEWVPPGAAFADIGTDHAALPIWLVLHGRVSRCLASDLRREPLRRAREAAHAWGAEIGFRLCDGLRGISPDEAEVIAIAGLGGEKIASILEKAPWTADGRHTLLLQPMTRAEELRRFLAEHGYAIQREAVVRERDTLYTVMEAAAGEMHPTEGQLYGGVELLHDPLGDRYLIEQILRLQNALGGLNHAIRMEEKRLAEREDAQRRENSRKREDAQMQENSQEREDAQRRENSPEREDAKRQENSRERERRKAENRRRAIQSGRDRARGNREKAERIREVLTELLAMREAWRHANSPGN